MDESYSDLILLEQLSQQISDFIHLKDYGRINDLDKDRKLIIKNFQNKRMTDIKFKEKLNNIIKDNEALILDLEKKISLLKSEHYNFNKRLKFYNLSK